MAQSSPAPIGSWREHLPYQSSIDLAFYQDKLMTATPFSLFSYSTSNQQIERYSQMGILSHTGVQFIQSFAQQSSLLVAYHNNAIDIFNSSGKKNIPDISRSNQMPAKGLNAAYIENENIYLCTAIGIVCINAARAEVTETWRIGSNGQDIQTRNLVKYQSRLYAATDEGLKYAESNGNNLADYQYWLTASGNNGLPTGPVQRVLILNNNLICLIKNNWYILLNNQWQLFYADTAETLTAEVLGNRLVLFQTINNESRLAILDLQGNISSTISHPLLKKPKRILGTENNYWIADSINGLLHFENAAITPIHPSSPAGISEGKIIWAASSLFATRGTVKNNTGSNLSGEFYVWNNSEWTNYTQKDIPALSDLPDIHSLAYDVSSKEFYTASWGAGVQRWKDGNLIAAYSENVMGAAPYTIASLSFDKKLRLWVSHAGNTEPVKVFDPGSNSWTAISLPYSFAENQISDIIVGNNNSKWILLGSMGLLAYDEGSTWNQTSDDRWKLFQFGSGNGNLPGSIVTTAVEDKNGFLWIGTNQGIGIIECANIFGSNTCEAFLPVVRSGNFAGNLFRETEILSIAVDGDNRKWVGTPEGAWLVSATGDSILQYFNTSNSPILHNRVHSIAIDPVTGDVYFATASGICSWRGYATEPQPKADIQIFPNPVAPDFNGRIAIRGLQENSIVKIVEQNGRLLYQTRSLGGQAIWDGKDYKGNKVATGVYLVLVSGENRKETTAGKIVFIKP